MADETKPKAPKKEKAEGAAPAHAGEGKPDGECGKERGEGIECIPELKVLLFAIN